MKAWERRVQRREGRDGSPALCPWELADWKRLSEAEKRLALHHSVATYPDRDLARQFRAIEGLSAVERQARIEAFKAKAKELPV